MDTGICCVADDVAARVTVKLSTTLDMHGTCAQECGGLSTFLTRSALAPNKCRTIG